MCHSNLNYVSSPCACLVPEESLMELGGVGERSPGTRLLVVNYLIRIGNQTWVLWKNICAY